ncbi:hypothetical protein [Noviherbaspirillum aerium]|uniref:hypothetical protein n=1 Tax=Noviherbaspirillum aerium TaxID=2588497 RepID=UPI00124CD02C|nr:hypothetical protein [Noviherbaspirillum aerium]
MNEIEILESKLRLALQQIDSLPRDSGIDPEHLRFVRVNLTAYLKQVEDRPESILSSDLSCVSRLVIEYWPLSLPAGEAVIAAEEAMKKFVEK